MVNKVVKIDLIKGIDKLKYSYVKFDEAIKDQNPSEIVN